MPKDSKKIAESSIETVEMNGAENLGAHVLGKIQSDPDFFQNEIAPSLEEKGYYAPVEKDNEFDNHVLVVDHGLPRGIPKKDLNDYLASEEKREKTKGWVDQAKEEHPITKKEVKKALIKKIKEAIIKSFGNIVGKTQSGRRVYSGGDDNKWDSKYSNYSDADHGEASRVHMGAASKEKDIDKRDNHMAEALQHMTVGGGIAHRREYKELMGKFYPDED